MKRIYQLGNTYFSIEKITKVTKPWITSSTSENLRPEFREVKDDLKTLTLWIDDKRYQGMNYWDSDFNVGITKDTVAQFEKFKEQAVNLFEAFISR